MYCHLHGRARWGRSRIPSLSQMSGGKEEGGGGCNSLQEQGGSALPSPGRQPCEAPWRIDASSPPTLDGLAMHNHGTGWQAQAAQNKTRMVSRALPDGDLTDQVNQDGVILSS